MKKAILFAAALFVAVASFAQNEYNYQKRSLFEQLPIRGNDIVSVSYTHLTLPTT